MNLGKPIAVGNTAEIYLHDNAIIKLFNDYLPDTEADYEATKQRYAYSSGLSVPKVLEVTKVDGKQAIIMEYVKGKTLGELLLENMEQAEYYIGISIDVQRKVHSIAADSLEPMSAKLSRQIQSAHHLDDLHKSLLLDKLESFTYEDRLCHGDFHLFNIIQSENKMTIIDWVDASAGDIRADVCRSYLLYTQFSDELADIYLRLYCEKSGLSKEDILEWAPIIAGARLSERVATEKVERLLDIVNEYYPI